MVKLRVEIVDTNSVHTEPLHESSIAQAHLGIAQRVDTAARVETRRATRLVSAEVLALVIQPESACSYATPTTWKRLPSTLLTKSAPLTTKGVTAETHEIRRDAAARTEVKI